MGFYLNVFVVEHKNKTILFHNINFPAVGNIKDFTHECIVQLHCGKGNLVFGEFLNLPVVGILL